MSTSMSRRSFVKACGVVGAAAGLAGCGSSSSDSNDSSDSSSSSQVGGTLTMYTPNAQELVDSIIDDFEDKTGIQVELIQAGTGELFAKLESEKDNPNADVIWGGSTAAFRNDADLFEDYTSANDSGVIEQYRNTEGYMTNFCLDGSVLILNNKLCDGLDIKGYADLLNDSLKDKITTADPANSASAYSQLTQILLDMGGYESDQAWDYVKQLWTLIDGKIASGSSNVYKTVSDGEFAVGLSYEDPCVQLLIDGADISIVYPEEGTVFLPAQTAIIKNCKNEDQAKAWIDYIVSQDAQAIIASKTTSRPVRDDVTLNENMKPMDEITTKTEDEEYVAEHQDEILQKYNDIYTATTSA